MGFRKNFTWGLTASYATTMKWETWDAEWWRQRPQKHRISAGTIIVKSPRFLHSSTICRRKSLNEYGPGAHLWFSRTRTYCSSVRMNLGGPEPTESLTRSAGVSARRSAGRVTSYRPRSDNVRLKFPNLLRRSTARNIWFHVKRGQDRASVSRSQPCYCCTA